MCTASGVKYSSLIHSLCLSSAFFTTCSQLGCTCLEYTILLISFNPTSSTERQRKQKQLNPGTQSYPKPSCLGNNWDLPGSLASLWSLESLFTFWVTISGFLSFCLDCRKCQEREPDTGAMMLGRKTDEKEKEMTALFPVDTRLELSLSK